MKLHMNRIKLVLVALISIYILSDHILGELSKTRMSQYYYMEIRCWLIDFNYKLLKAIALIVYYIMIRYFAIKIRK